MTKIIENIARAYNHISMLRGIITFPWEVALVHSEKFYQLDKSLAL
jgi:hypothetical protein